MTRPTLAPIWLPHWPACRCTISLILKAAICGVEGYGWNRILVSVWRRMHRTVRVAAAGFSDVQMSRGSDSQLIRFQNEGATSPHNAQDTTDRRNKTRVRRRCSGDFESTAIRVPTLRPERDGRSHSHTEAPSHRHAHRYANSHSAHSGANAELSSLKLATWQLLLGSNKNAS